MNSLVDNETKANAITDWKSSLIANGLATTVLLSVVTAVFAQACSFPFIIYDDHYYVTDNPGVLNGLTQFNVYWAFTTGYFSNWHPLTWLSLQLDADTGGGSPFTFHLTNVALHVATTLVIYGIYLRLTRNWIVACFAASLYAIHPLHVESVAWVSERKGILSTFFLSVTVLSYLWFVRRPSFWRGLFVVSPYILSLMSKQMGVTLPLLLPLLHLLLPANVASGEGPLEKKIIRRAIVLYACLFLLGIVFSVIAYVAQQSGGALQANTKLPLAFRLQTSIVNYSEYLFKYIWPNELSCYYHNYLNGEPWKSVLLSAGFIFLSLAIAIRTRVRFPVLLFAMAWYLIAFLPVIGIIQIGDHRMANRYSDWPLVGIHLLASMLLWQVTHLLKAKHVQYKTFIVVALLTISGLSIRSYREAKYWSSDKTLYSRSLEIDPINPKAHVLLGEHLIGTGELDLAEMHLKQGIEGMPWNGHAFSNLGMIELRRKHYAGADAFFVLALNKVPGLYAARLNRGVALTRLGEFNEAESVTRSIIEEYPIDFESQLNLANILRLQEKFEEAIRHYESAIRIKPTSSVAWHYLGDSLQGNGFWQKAMVAHIEAIKVSDANLIDSVRSLLRLRLLQAQFKDLPPLLDRIDIIESPATLSPERAMYIANTVICAGGNKDALELVSVWLDAQRAQKSDRDFFIYEAMGDCADTLGLSNEAKTLWEIASKLHPETSRNTANANRNLRMQFRIQCSNQ